ncbi:MAG: hypothetical protein J1F63_07065 [Oscillospiraceae bacterium]|nr:hypothetical protein [Oscillospiraceae bacterium]
MKKIFTLLGALAILLTGAITALADEPLWAFLPDVKTDTNWSYWDDMAAYKVEYPILEYNNTLYLPMTFRNCLEIGMAMAWQNDTLYLTFCGRTGWIFTSKHEVYDHPWRFECCRAEYTIFLNGETLSGSVDGMPILNYRGVTYLPLTETVLRELHMELRWDQYNNTMNIRVIEPGWEYEFDGIYNNDGRQIDYVVLNLLKRGNNYRSGYYLYNSFDGKNVTNNGKYSMTYSVVGGLEVEDRPEVWHEIEPVDVTEWFWCENGKLMHGDEPIDDMTGMVMSALEYHLGDGVSVLTVNRGYTSQRHYFCANGAYAAIRYFDPVHKNEFFQWLKTEDGSVYFTDEGHRLNAITPGGRALTAVDVDHNYFRLIGLIGGRPLVQALWNGEAELDGFSTGSLISPVNDGFFTIEEDGSLEKYMDYRYSSYAFILNDRLYLVDMYENCFIDTVTGEKISIDDADIN